MLTFNDNKIYRSYCFNGGVELGTRVYVTCGSGISRCIGVINPDCLPRPIAASQKKADASLDFATTWKAGDQKV